MAQVFQRLLALIPVLLLVTLVVFSFNFLTPGDAAQFVLGEHATDEQIESLRKELGLDKPVIVQYGNWLLNLIKGDLGRSFLNNEPVATALKNRLEPTLQLGLMGMVIGLLIAIPLGTLAATRADTFLDRLLTGMSALGLALPNFWLGILLIYLFSLNLGWLPPSGYSPIGKGLIKNLQLMIMPALALGLGFGAVIMRQTRAAVLEALQEDYIRTVQAKGLGDWQILFKHALRNALIPILTIIGVRLSQLIGGTVVIETIFGIPGIGRWAVNALLNKDLYVTQAVVMSMGVFVVVVNLVVELAYQFVDPRIRHQ